MLNPPYQMNAKFYAEIILVWVVLVFLNMAYIAYNSSMATKFAVSATALPAFDFQVVQQASALRITPSDIKKGYADIEVETVFTHATNDPLGYIVLVTTNRMVNPREIRGGRNFSSQENGKGGMHELFTSITIASEGHAYQVTSGSSVEIMLPTLSSTRETKRFRYRFYLAPQVKEGLYPWPIILTLAPM
jgi:hypothetical protein